MSFFGVAACGFVAVEVEGTADPGLGICDASRLHADALTNVTRAIAERVRGRG